VRLVRVDVMVRCRLTLDIGRHGRAGPATADQALRLAAL